jgi:shikimate dehydrogenase
MSFPDARTRLAAVVGHPVAHSLSPPIHNAALRHDGLNAVYLAFDVRPERFADAVDGMRELGAVGCNVTIPHKEAALEVAATRGPSAERIGAANTLVFASDGVVAHNTDPDGVRGVLTELSLDPRGNPCLVLGAGGAGRGAAWALAEAGADPLVLANRTGERAVRLAADLAEAGFGCRHVGWEEAPRAAASGAIVVNATSVGLSDGASPLDETALRGVAVGGCRLVLDLVYAPGETALVRSAREHGLVAVDGLGVLVHQAASAYALFWGRAAPVDVMREAADRAAGRRGGRPGEEAEAVPPLV